MGNFLHTLLLPFDSRALQPPAAGQNWVVLNAETLPLPLPSPQALCRLRMLVMEAGRFAFLRALTGLWVLNRHAGEYRALPPVNCGRAASPTAW